MKQPKATRPPASSPAARKTMQANRSKNTMPELELRRLLREAGYPGYRLHWKKAPGHPDIAYPGRKVAIFVNGCFWHRCPHCNPSHPKANREYWTAKFRATEERDARNCAELEVLGWSVAVVWGCELRDEPKETIHRLAGILEKKGIQTAGGDPACEGRTRNGKALEAR